MSESSDDDTQYPIHPFSYFSPYSTMSEGWNHIVPIIYDCLSAYQAANPKNTIKSIAREFVVVLSFNISTAKTP